MFNVVTSLKYFLFFSVRNFAKKNVKIDKIATLPPRYQSHEELFKSKLYTPESIHSRDIPHIFLHAYKHNLLDTDLVTKYIARAQVLSPQFTAKDFALIIHTVSKFGANCMDIHVIIQFIITMSSHLPSRLRYSHPKDLGMISLSLVKLNDLIMTQQVARNKKYFKALEIIIKRISNEAPSKLPFFDIPELAALAASLTYGNISVNSWAKLTLYDLSVEMVDKLEAMLIDQKYTDSIMNDILSFICSMERANVDNRGFWNYISSFLTNNVILSITSANNAVVLANALYKRFNVEKLLESAIDKIEKTESYQLPRIVSLGLFVSHHTKSQLFKEFIRYLTPELISTLNCIQLTQVVTCIGVSSFDSDASFIIIKNAVYKRIEQLIDDSSMTPKGSVTMLTSMSSKQEFGALPTKLVNLHAITS